MTTIYGSIISPFVRKVLMVLEFKNIAYKIHSINPYNPEHKKELFKIHPLGIIPIYKNNNIIIPDSSVICAYLEKKYPGNSLYPSNPEDYAKSLWFEEYADSHFINISRALFWNHTQIAAVLQHEGNDAVYEDSLKKLPDIFNYLESNLIENKFYLVGCKLSIADISIIVGFLNLEFIGLDIDSNKWPKLVHYIANIGQEKCISIISQQAREIFNQRFV
jgi:glutathione S-transferase